MRFNKQERNEMGLSQIPRSDAITKKELEEARAKDIKNKKAPRSYRVSRKSNR